MRLSVQAIMESVSASTNQEASLPTGSEYTLWLSYLNRAIAEWANSHDWEDLKKTFSPTISGTSQTTVPLPLDFRTFAGPVKHWGTGISEGEDWPIILEEKMSLQHQDDHYLYVRGDISSGYNLIWNPGTLASGASLSVPYFSMPTSLASPAQVPVVPDSQFLVDRSIAFILEARSDPRYQNAEENARNKLVQMIENSDSAKYNSYINPSYVESVNKRTGFRIGRN